MKMRWFSLVVGWLCFLLTGNAYAALANVAGQATGPTSALQLNVTVTDDPADAGASKSVWIAAYVPQSGYFFRNSAGAWVPWTAGTAVPSPVTTTTSDVLTLDALGGTLNVAGLPGTSVFVGFAQNATELINNGEYALVYTVPQANATNNVATISLDPGPAVLTSAENNIAYVTVRICVPGTSNCTNVDHIQVDTGSEGLRILTQALNPTFAAALPQSLTSQSTPIGECLEFVDGYVWGSVRTADFYIAGEKVLSMPMQLIDASFASIPSQCSSSGGSAENTIATFGANGIIGIGPQLSDCGAACTQPTLQYYSCAGITCTEVGLPQNQQVPNPIADFAVDNNGSLMQFPAFPQTGQRTATGSLIFGIGTQSNNSLGSAKVYTIDASGFFTTTYKGTALTESYVDSGTSLLVFPDSTITQCDGNFFCPTSMLSLSATNTGRNNASGVVNFEVTNANTLFGTGYSVLPSLAVSGGSTTSVSASGSFAWGLPFFYGRTVFTALPGKSTPGGVGPYFAY